MKLTSVELSKIQAAICEHPYESRSEQIRVTIIVGTTITYTAVLLRFISRYFLAQRFGLDDWFILAAIVCVSCLINERFYHLTACSLVFRYKFHLFWRTT